MNSRLYNCKVTHNRLRPKQHRFSYRIFMFYIDIDEIDTISKKVRLFGHNSFNLYSLNDQDHAQEGKSSIRGNIEQYLANQGISDRVGKIYLLTHLRTWGHIFNPVSFYFIQDEQGEPMCSIAEVANTFKEQKLFLLDQETNRQGEYRKTEDKLFYVSPFSDLDTKFAFILKEPDERLAISINQSDSESTFFYSSLVGEQKPLTNRQLIAYSFKFPFVTLGVLWGIHWQALKLWMKGIRARKKAENPELQVGSRPYLKHNLGKPRHLN